MSFGGLRVPYLPTVKDILRVYGLKAEKQLSQNFLLQPRIVSSLVDKIGNVKNKSIIEVGSGPGCLTREIILREPKNLISIEIDRRFVPILSDLQLVSLSRNCNMEIYRADILQLPLNNIFDDSTKIEVENFKIETEDFFDDYPVKVIGNLPFNISTPLVVKWAHDIAEKRGLWSYGPVPMVLTFQKEVAERLSAQVWDEQRSRLSIILQMFCDVEYLRTISGSSFSPKADVDVGVVRIIPKIQPLIPGNYFLYLEKLVKHSFQFRGKKLLKNLQSLFPINNPQMLINFFEESGVNPLKKAVQLDIEEFRNMTTVYYRMCARDNSLFEFNAFDKDNLASWNNRHNIQKEILGKSLIENYYDK